eukprot:492388-Alexandrium_andersonii.AAC.1
MGDRISSIWRAWCALRTRCLLKGDPVLILRVGRPDFSARFAVSPSWGRNDCALIAGRTLL